MVDKPSKLAGAASSFEHFDAQLFSLHDCVASNKGVGTCFIAFCTTPFWAVILESKRYNEVYFFQFWDMLKDFETVTAYIFNCKTEKKTK